MTRPNSAAGNRGIRDTALPRRLSVRTGPREQKNARPAPDHPRRAETALRTDSAGTLLHNGDEGERNRATVEWVCVRPQTKTAWQGLAETWRPSPVGVWPGTAQPYPVRPEPKICITAHGSARQPAAINHSTPRGVPTNTPESNGTRPRLRTMSSLRNEPPSRPTRLLPLQPAR